MSGFIKLLKIAALKNFRDGILAIGGLMFCNKLNIILTNILVEFSFTGIIMKDII